MEFLLFGIVGFAIGAGLLYWLGNRKIESLKRRLDQKKNSINQAEALNRQQTAKMQQLQQSQILLQEREQAHEAQIQQLQTSHQAEIEQIRQELEADYQAKLAAKEQAHQLQMEEWQQAQPSKLETTVDSERSEATGQEAELELWEDGANAEQALLDVLLEEEEEENIPILPENGFSPESIAELSNPWEQTIASGTETFKRLELEESQEEDEQNPPSNPFLVGTEGQDSEKDTIPFELDIAEAARSESLKSSVADKLSDADLDLALFEELSEPEEFEIKSQEATLNGDDNPLAELLPELEQSTRDEPDLLAMLSLENQEKQTTETTAHGQVDPLPEWLSEDQKLPEKE